MYESSAKPAMSASSAPGAGLAIVPDRKPSHRPEGCVGSILFQLFEWNRRFAKKKLFPRKLLPPVRATKMVTKKFADEKMPVAKFLLIAADENRGGYPNQKKAPEANAVSSPATATTITTVRNSGMRSPSLVARLMGLEAMPAASQDKPRKTVDSLDCHEGSQSSCSSRHDLDLDLKVVAGGGHGKQDFMPQKLQKTGFFERQPVNEAAARVGSEVLQLNRSVLSRGRKQHHKFASPVKSPRLLTRKNSSRLMGAAVKILEPGLQRRNQARSLTYGTPSQRNPGASSSREKSSEQRNPGASSSPEKSCEQPRKYVSPCKNCGSGMMGVADRNPAFEQPPSLEDDRKHSASNFPMTSASSSEGLNMRRIKQPFYSSGENPSCRAAQGEDISENRHFMYREKHSQYARDQCNFNADDFRIRNSSYTSEEKPSSFLSQAEGNAEKKLLTDRKQRSQYEQARCNSSVENSMPTRGEPRQNRVTKTKIPSARNKTTGPSSCIRQQSRKEPGSASGYRDSIVQNRNTTSRAQAMALPRLQITAKIETSQQKNLIPRRKPLKGNTPTRSTSASKSTPPKNRTGRSTSAPVTEARFVNARSRKQANNTRGTGSKDTNMVSFTFNAPYRRDSESDSSAIIARRTKKSFTKTEHANASFPAKAVTHSRAEASERPDTVRGDELSALLEQKIKELNFLEQEESLTDAGSKSGRSTATILQELISALTDGGASETTTSYGCTANKMQEEATGESAGLSPLGYGCDQPSPISILEASFSTDSCLSESLHSMSGQVLNFGVTEEGSCDKSQESWDPEADFSDSATSCNIGKMETAELSCSLDGITTMYNFSRQFGHPLSRPSYIRALVSNIVLLLGDCSGEEVDYETCNSWMDALLVGALEMLWDACRENSWLGSSNLEMKDGAHLRRYLCDCMIEYLDSKYGKPIISSWKKQPSASLSSKNLVEDVYRNIGRWTELASMNLDDMIENELGRLPVQWIDFESEACETGEEIQQDILQALVDEAVIEFLPC